jgi:hypothetical protein
MLLNACYKNLNCMSFLRVSEAIQIDFQSCFGIGGHVALFLCPPYDFFNVAVNVTVGWAKQRVPTIDYVIVIIPTHIFKRLTAYHPHKTNALL